METQISEKEIVKEKTGKVWWLFLLRGIAALVFGFYAVLRPGITISAFVTILGWYWLLEGIFTIFLAVTGQSDEKKWYWALLGGLVNVIIAIIVLGAPLLSAALVSTTLLWVIAIGAVLSGLFNIINAIRLRKEIENELSIILSGVLSLIFGILVFTSPLAFGRIIVLVLGIMAILNGIGLVVLAFRVRRLSKAL